MPEHSSGAASMSPNAFGQLIDKRLRRDGVFGVSAVGVIAGEAGRVAEVFLAPRAEAAVAARVAQPRHAHSLANLQVVVREAASGAAQACRPCRRSDARE